VDDERLPESLSRIDDDLGVRVGREPELLGLSVGAVGEAAEVLADDRGEVLLPSPYDGEERRSSVLLA